MVEPFLSTLLETPADAARDGGRQVSLPRLLRFVAWCWLAYVAVLYLLDTALVARNEQLHLLPPLYYLLHAAAALLLVGMAASSWVQRRLGHAFLPLAIICLAALPLAITALLAPFAIGPISGSRGFVILRFAPVSLVGIMLLAWHYPWVVILRANLALMLLLVIPTVGSPQLATTTLVLALLQMVSFLVISYCVHTLLDRLRRQSAALRHANHQLRQYVGTLEQLTISRERNRVARELHDTLAHTLSSLSVQLETVKAYWAIDPPAARALLESALATTRSGLNETRRALDALRAQPLDDVGLQIALSDMIAAAAELANLRLELSLPDQLPPLAPATEQAIYRIAQEALANITHHAEAQLLRAAILLSDSQLVVRLQDDGRGFDMRECQQRGHFGLAGMAERAALIGGQLTISSAPGAGTLIELTVALDEGGPDARPDL